MKKRAKIKIEITTNDKILEIVGWISLFAIWSLTIVNYNSLPDIIPIHYNAAGESDGFGRKAYILMLPLISTTLFVGLTILNKFPHIFNYPTGITEENAQRQYTNATRLIRYLKFIIVLIIGYISFMTIQNAHGKAEGLGSWFTPLFLVLVFLPLLFFIVKSVKMK